MRSTQPHGSRPGAARPGPSLQAPARRSALTQSRFSKPRGRKHSQKHQAPGCCHHHQSWDPRASLHVIRARDRSQTWRAPPLPGPAPETPNQSAHPGEPPSSPIRTRKRESSAPKGARAIGYRGVGPRPVQRSVSLLTWARGHGAILWGCRPGAGGFPEDKRFRGEFCCLYLFFALSYLQVTTVDI